jgi:hypothetical protein
VLLGGDAELVADVTSLLASRGISADAGGCPALAVSVERKGRATVVSQGANGDPRESREVTDVRTAATVIESWVRRPDLEAPLLARRPAAPSAQGRDGEAPDRLVVTAPPATARRGLQLFTFAETGLASDRTTWAGMQVGACSLLGPVCLGGRARLATVVDGPDEWEGTMGREGVDALVDADVPAHAGLVAASWGLGVGLGWTRTHEEQRPPDSQERLGLRAEAHAGLSIPLARRLSIESTVALSLGGTVQSLTATNERLPADPRIVGRFGLGLRFGGP